MSRGNLFRLRGEESRLGMRFYIPLPRSAIFTVIRSAAFNISIILDDSLEPDSIVDWRENASTDIALVDKDASPGIDAGFAMGIGV